MTRMRGCYPLAKEHAILNMESQIQILDIDTQRSNKWKRVNRIIDILTGERMPRESITPVGRGSLKPPNKRKTEHFQDKAKTKVLIEYEEDQEVSSDEEPTMSSHRCHISHSVFGCLPFQTISSSLSIWSRFPSPSRPVFNQAQNLFYLLSVAILTFPLVTLDQYYSFNASHFPARNQLEVTGTAPQLTFCDTSSGGKKEGRGDG